MHFATGSMGCSEVSTPIQYTTGQDMFGCRHGRFSTQPLRKLLKRTLVKKSGPVPGPEGESGGPVHRFSTQPHKICLGVDIDGSVHNRSELIVTQAHFKRKASSVLHLRSMHFAVVPVGVRRSVHR